MICSNIATSYFKSSYINKTKLNKIAISRTIPCNLEYNIIKYDKLIPTWEMINLKNDANKYTELYYSQILNKLNPIDVINDLRNCLLLCWEKPNIFCHRHIITEWIKNNTNIIILELNNKNYKMFV